MKIFTTKNTGATLIELLIVILLLGILLTIVFLRIVPQLQKARDSHRKMDLYAMRNAIELYYDETECFPETLPTCDDEFAINGSIIYPHMPCDPQEKIPYRYVTDESSCSQWYQLYSLLEYPYDTDIDTLRCRGGCGPNCAYNYGVTSTNIDLDRCITYYVCATGTSSCEAYDDPEKSQCPVIFENDPTCDGGSACTIPSNRCKNSSGKHVPDK